MKIAASYRKLRGGYYTPKPIAEFLAEWAIRTQTDRILEPSCGDGIFLTCAADVLLRRGAVDRSVPDLIQGVEIDAEEVDKALERVRSSQVLPQTASIHVGDFFAYAKEHLAVNGAFDAILGNPPFIRYHDFSEDQRTVAFYLMRLAGLHPNRLTNAWVPFIVAATLMLTETGRLAMVVPAELLQVNYAGELRQYLSRCFRSITLVTFRRLVFDHIQQEVVLLLAERGGHGHAGIRTIELGGAADLARYEEMTVGQPKELDHSNEKWTMYFLEQDELDLLRKLKLDSRLCRAGNVLGVDVGIVTGLNEFFVMSQQQVAQYGLESYTTRIVSRSTHLRGTIFSDSDWRLSAECQAPAFLLNPPPFPRYSLAPELDSYLRRGEEMGVNTGYKCGLRGQWYRVPSVWVPPAFMLRQVHTFPKIVVNDAGATCTDTIHRVIVKNGVPARTIAAAFLNSLTFAFAEVLGRSYGGGVLELEPTEAESLPLPLLGADFLDNGKLDSLLRTSNIEAVLEVTDTVLLREGLGLSRGESQMLRAIWRKLRDRRVNRRPDRVNRSIQTGRLLFSDAGSEGFA